MQTLCNFITGLAGTAAFMTAFLYAPIAMSESVLTFPEFLMVIVACFGLFIASLYAIND